MTLKSIYRIFGAGGHAKVVIDALIASGVSVGGSYDADVSLHGREVVPGILIHGDEKRLLADLRDEDCVIIAIGENRVRKRLAGMLRVRYGVAVAPSAVVGARVEIGQGAMVLPSATVNCDTTIGGHAILNTSCSVDHDCRIEDFVHIAPGTHLGGNVTVGEGTFLGIGTSVIPGVRIGRWSIVGAGTVVTKDIPDNCTAVGVPARVVKSRPEGWHLA